MRERQEQAAAALDHAIFELAREMPQAVMPRLEAEEPLRRAHAALREAWSRSTVLNSPEVDERIAALDMTLFIAFQDTRHLARGEQVNFWPLSVAVRDVRRALAAFQRREDLPEPEFPSAREVVALSSPDGRDVGLDGVRHALILSFPRARRAVAKLSRGGPLWAR